MVALHEGQPKLLNLKQILEAFLSHRREVVTRQHDITICEKHAIVRTYWKDKSVALANIDEVIALIQEPHQPLQMRKLALVGRGLATRRGHRICSNKAGCNRYAGLTPCLRKAVTGSS